MFEAKSFRFCFEVVLKWLTWHFNKKPGLKRCLFTIYLSICIILPRLFSSIKFEKKIDYKQAKFRFSQKTNLAIYLGNIHLSKINKRNTRAKCGILSKLTIKKIEYVIDFILVLLVLILEIFQTILSLPVVAGWSGWMWAGYVFATVTLHKGTFQLRWKVFGYFSQLLIKDNDRLTHIWDV